MVVKVGNNPKQFQLLNKLVDISFKKLIQSKYKNSYGFQKQVRQQEQQEWTVIAFGDSLIDKNGNLIKNPSNSIKKKKNIYEELSSNSYNIIDRLKQNTQQKIQSLNTHIITNELKELNSYFDHCKNNLMKFFIEENKEIDEIWSRSKQDYQPTLKLMELWKEKLEFQLDELKVKMSGLEKELMKKIEKIRVLKEKLDVYDVDTRDNATQTPGLYDYRMLELNQQERLIQLESKRLFDLISSYESMLKQQFKVDDSKYNKIKQQMMKSMNKIKKLELENIQIKQQFEKQNETNNQDIFNNDTFELLKQMRLMPAFQKQMYNSSIVKFINIVKKMSKSSINEQMLVTLGLEGQTADLRIDKKMFVNIQEQDKNMIQQIQRRRSKIIQFDIGKIHQSLDVFKRKSIIDVRFSPDVSPSSSQTKIKRKERRLSKMRSLELKGKKIEVLKNEKSDMKQISSRKNILSNLKEIIESQIQSRNENVSSRESQSIRRSARKQLVKKSIDSQNDISLISLNQTPKSSKRGSSRQLQLSTSRQQTKRINKTPQTPNHFDNTKNSQKKIGLNRDKKNSIIIEQPIYENLKTNPVESLTSSKKFSISIAIQTDEMTLICSTCNSQYQYINQEQIQKSYTGKNVLKNISNVIISKTYEDKKEQQSIILKQLELNKTGSSKISQSIGITKSKHQLGQSFQNHQLIQIKQNFKRKQLEKLSTTPKLVLNKLYKDSIQRNTSNTQKLSLNTNSLQESTINYSSSYNSPVQKSIKQPLKKIGNSEFQKKSKLSNKIFQKISIKQIRIGNTDKIFKRNSFKDFHSLFQNSLNQLRNLGDSRMLQEIKELEQCSDVEVMISKFREIHQKKCTSSNCTHLSRFYQNLKRIEKDTLPRKSPMPLKTLKIQKIDHN